MFGFDLKSKDDGEYADSEGLKWDIGLPTMYSFTFVDDGDEKGVRTMRQSTVMDMGEFKRKITER